MFARFSFLFLAVVLGGVVAGVIVKSLPDHNRDNQDVVVAAVQTSSQQNSWTTEIRAARNGHFYVEAIVQSSRLRFLVDTGATVTALSREAAEQLNIHLSDRDFNGIAHTASGISRTARVTIPTIRIDDNWIYDLPAIVIEDFHGTSLLGMNFLRELDRYEISDQLLTLYW